MIQYVYINIQKGFFIMNINEMEQFSIEELENFAIRELGKTPEELVKAISVNGSEISYNSYKKLCELCDIVNLQVKKSDMIPKPLKTVKSVIDCIYKLLMIIKSIPTIKDVIIPYLLDLFS